jgi:hypothetical protein
MLYLSIDSYVGKLLMKMRENYEEQCGDDLLYDNI